MTDEKRSLRVLLVEDDPEDVAIFRRYVERLETGRVVMDHVTETGEALTRLAGGGFDLLFIDLNLGGGGNGMDLLERLQQRGIDTPAIMVTGAGDETKAVCAMKAGAYDYLVKNELSAGLLRRTIRNAQRRHALERERTLMTEKLVELSITDELTGLPNRRHLMRKLEEEIARAQRTGHPFALLMIDLDHFKKVNDRHGHPTGDRVLRECADCLRQNIRRTDIAGRYGGEEFCVLLPETSGEGAHRSAEKLRRAVGALPDPAPTISVGVAVRQTHASAEAILRDADEALYEAKAAGRDCVVVHCQSQRRAAESAHHPIEVAQT